MFTPPVPDDIHLHTVRDLEGYQQRLYLDDEGVPMPYDHMHLWIDGKQLASRGYEQTVNAGADMDTDREKKFGHEAHPSINEENTHTTEEMESPEFRARVGTFKRIVLGAAVDLGENNGVFWQAIHELVLELLEADKGEEHADQYLKALKAYEEWSFSQELAPAQDR